MFLLGFRSARRSCSRPYREPRRFPKAAVQGAFASRDFHCAASVGAAVRAAGAGKRARLPLPPADPDLQQQGRVSGASGGPLRLLSRAERADADQVAGPSCRAAHRPGSAARSSPEIPTEVLLIQGNEDRIVARRYFEQLKAALPRAEGVILPTVGHQPHLTHAEVWPG